MNKIISKPYQARIVCIHHMISRVSNFLMNEPLYIFSITFALVLNFIIGKDLKWNFFQPLWISWMWGYTLIWHVGAHAFAWKRFNFCWPVSTRRFSFSIDWWRAAKQSRASFLSHMNLPTLIKRAYFFFEERDIENEKCNNLTKLLGAG